ncbi:LLM class F420-dependent oxidoreductase [Dactylosporangium darangshiense]|uniref:Luciferase-like domain-containing protein n=1 Tax=Dactylosporangium darangshiense TaxID=579108 RepID=A0ABP8DCX2_9ACTN
MSLQFGVSLPTCVEGMAYPIRFADHTGIARVAAEAERLGYDSVLVNDHLSTMPYVRAGFDEPPRFYEPMVTLSYLAAQTSTIRLMTGVVVAPMREPVLLAKQASVLDQLSGGRLILGVGVGAYRAEFESVRPDFAGVPRAELVEESLEALRLLFRERVASYDGRHVRFSDVEMYPKPVQHPLPLYSSGNAAGTLRRAARLCDGWMPAGLPAARLAEGVRTLRANAEAGGRDPAAIAIAPQMVLCLGDDAGDAISRFRASQVYEHLVSLRATTLKGIDIDAYVSENLIGDAAAVTERIARLAEAGADHLAGMIVVANTVDEMLEQMRRFAVEVAPAFRRSGT